MTIGPQVHAAAAVLQTSLMHCLQQPQLPLPPLLYLVHLLHLLFCVQSVGSALRIAEPHSVGWRREQPRGAY